MWFLEKLWNRQSLPFTMKVLWIKRQGNLLTSIQPPILQESHLFKVLRTIDEWNGHQTCLFLLKHNNKKKNQICFTLLHCNQTHNCISYQPNNVFYSDKAITIIIILLCSLKSFLIQQCSLCRCFCNINDFTWHFSVCLFLVSSCHR